MSRLQRFVYLGGIAAVAVILCAIPPMASADSIPITFAQFQGPLGATQTFGGSIDLNPVTPLLTLTGANWVSGSVSSPCSILSCSLIENFQGIGAYSGYFETVKVAWNLKTGITSSLSWVAVPEERTVFEVLAIILLLGYMMSGTSRLRRPVRV